MRRLEEARVCALQGVITVPCIGKRLREDAEDRLVCLGTLIMASILQHRLAPVAAKVMLRMAI